MRLIPLDSLSTVPITQYRSVGASSAPIADGHGDAHVHWLEFDAGASIGEHPTGLGQLFVVLEGSGWVAGADGRRVEIRAGQGAYFERGERHSKGSDHGMKALMIQITELETSASGSAG